MREPAHAQLARTFISANGVDTNTCARTAPCRTLQVAHNKTTAGGEINMLDPAGYGTVTITKSISIVNDGVGSAGILVPLSGVGITINAGDSDKINLRGLIIEGAGVGLDGIFTTSGASLTIENCVIRNLTNVGIQYAPAVASTLSVSSTFFADIGGIGINVSPSGTGAVKAVLSHIEVHNSGGAGVQIYGGISTGTLDATVADSVSTDNQYGLWVQTALSQAVTNVMVARSAFANNSVTGITVLGIGATLRLSRSTVTGNANGWIGPVQSYGDNYINGNASNESAPTSTPKK